LLPDSTITICTTSETVWNMKKALLALLTLLAFVLLAAGRAEAQANPLKRRPANDEAQRHLDQGNRFFRILDYEKAILEYKAGAAIEGHDIFYFNLAQAYRQTGRYEEAIRLYEQWLSRANPPADTRQGVEGLIEQMKAELAKKASKEPPTGPAADVATQQEAAPDEAPEPAPLVRASAPEPAGAPWYSDPVGWTGVGAGAIGTTVGAVLLVNGLRLRDDAQDATQQAERHDLADRADKRVTLGMAVGAVGAAVLTAGVVKLVIHERRPSSKSISVSFAPTGVGIAGRF
jgi:tetratricopeptide (TPR) repeat protein